MATVLELAAEYDLSPDAVETWLRAHGYGRPKGGLSVKTERAFRQAHDAHRSVAQWFVTPHRQSAPEPEPVPRQAKPRRPEPGIAHHYKRRHDELLGQYREATAERDAARAQADEAAARIEALEQEIARLEAARAVGERRSAPRDAAAWGSPLREALEAAGLFAEAGRQGLRALVADDRACDRLLDAARIDDLGPFTALAPVCADPICRAVAAIDGKVVVEAPALCAVCHGSVNRRWWQRMARACVARKRTRLIVVGGSDQSHANINALIPETPALSVSCVEGTSWQPRQRVRTRVQGADVVVLWSSTILDHKVSDVYKAEADACPRVLRVAVREGGRGVAALCQAVVEAIEGGER